MISEMERLRADGLVIREGMRIEQIAALGGIPCKVVDARWHWNKQRFVITNPLGLVAIVVPDRQSLAVLWNTDESSLEADLYVIAGDRSRQVEVPDELLINDTIESGIYGWFEDFPHESASVFTCMYTRRRDLAIFRVDIDPARGTVVRISPSR